MPTENWEETLTARSRSERRPAPSHRRRRSSCGAGRRRQGSRWVRLTSDNNRPAAGGESTEADELRTLMVMASHDLKNPLATVTAHIEMLRADYAATLDEGFAQDLAAIERGLHRMTQLTQDLLTYAKAGHTLNPTSVSLRTIVTDVLADHVTTVNPPEISVAETLPDVLADATLLRHVLDNLVGNAVKYTQAGVKPHIEITAGTHLAGTVLVEVTDCGIGIPAPDRPKAFDTFHRCANSAAYPGTGLGLAICKRIIEQHGGTIGVDENPGGGSRFWFTIPAARPSNKIH